MVQGGRGEGKGRVQGRQDVRRQGGRKTQKDKKSNFL